MNILPSLFTRYALTEQEHIEGCLLNANQKAVIQNLTADIAEEKLLLKFDPSNVAAYQQREAELQGQIGILKFLLAASDEAEETIRNSNTTTHIPE